MDFNPDAILPAEEERIAAFERNLVVRRNAESLGGGPNRVRIAVIAGLTILIIRDVCAHTVPRPASLLITTNNVVVIITEQRASFREGPRYRRRIRLAADVTKDERGGNFRF